VAGSGLTAKYTIPDARTAPVTKADTNFHFMRTALRAIILNATASVSVSQAEPLK
jgi:hypothetical protein